MKYEDFEVMDAASTVPAQAGVFTPGMGLALAAFLAATAILVVFLAKRRKHKSDVDGVEDLDFTSNSKTEQRRGATPVLVATFLVAVASGGVFALESLTPDRGAVQASQEQVSDNYSELFASYGLNTPDNVDQLRVGDLVETTTMNSDEPTTVKIQVAEDKVVLANINGGIRQQNSEG